jgi:hypothetical protein
MKTTLLTLTLLLGLTFGTMAENHGKKNTADRAASLKASITSVLKVPEFLKMNGGETSVELTFTINDSHELVVENVYTDDERLKAYVIDNLNGMTVSGELSINTVYSITLHFEVL